MLEVLPDFPHRLIVVGSILWIFSITFKITISAPIELNRYTARLKALSEDSVRSPVVPMWVQHPFKDPPHES